MTKSHRSLIVSTFAFSSILVCLSFLLQGSKGFSLWDEGYLWYGVQRVLLGEVPILDFLSYDPGRYYWVASFSYLFGDSGIMSVRFATAIFQCIGLFIGTLLVASSVKPHDKKMVVFWMIAGVTMMLWFWPRHKLFDISLSIFLLGTLTILIRKPNPVSYFVTGIVIGILAVFGRNHGIYGLVAFLGVFIWLTLDDFKFLRIVRDVSCWGSGVLVGFSPIIFMALFVPGFDLAFIDSVKFLIEAKATNLPTPVPWPWRGQYTGLTIGAGVRKLLVGIFFIALFAFGVLTILWCFRKKISQKELPPALVAAAFCSLPYAHVASSRSDLSHLAQAVFPALIGCLIILASSKNSLKWLGLTAIFLTSIWIMYPVHPGWQCRSSQLCINVEVANRTLTVKPSTAKDIALLRQLSDQYTPNGESFIVIPFWPGAYALLERKSPIWEIYAIIPRSRTFELKEIERIKDAQPRFVLIFDYPLDSRDELRFKNTHPLTHSYIEENFEPMLNSPTPAYKIYTKSR